MLHSSRSQWPFLAFVPWLVTVSLLMSCASTEKDDLTEHPVGHEHDPSQATDPADATKIDDRVSSADRDAAVALMPDASTMLPVDAAVSIDPDAAAMVGTDVGPPADRDAFTTQDASPMPDTYASQDPDATPMSEIDASSAPDATPMPDMEASQESDATPMSEIDASSARDAMPMLAMDASPDPDATPMPAIDASQDPDAEPMPATDASLPINQCDVNEVFDRNGCLACHGANAELNGGGIYLVSERLQESVVGVVSRSPGCANEVLVNIENPESSILLHALSVDRDRNAIEDECRPMPMPLGGFVHIAAEDVDCVEQWIRTLEPRDVEQPEVLYPAPALTVLTRVKYLLDGGALSAEELQHATGPDGQLIRAGLEALIENWMSTERFRQKRRQFLELHLQQTPSDINYFTQFRNTRTNSLAPVREVLNQSFIRTAERIIDDGEDFRSIVTTNRWEVTTITLLALKMADNPMILKPNGVWPKNNGINDIRFVMNQPNLYDLGSDSEDWRTVTLIHNPDTLDMITENEILDPVNAARLRAVPDGGAIELRAPRLGFFTTPAFFQTWQTNRDNDFRVTINQAMIIATGLTFSPGDNTPLSGDDNAVDMERFPRHSTCYGCHKNLDVMRAAFLMNYDNINTRHTERDAPLPSPGFSFRGHRADVEDLHAWADALANHPNFAVAWVLKLCQWASSYECAPTDEHVVALAAQFVDSGYDLSQLFADFFASPLMTMTSDRVDTSAPAAQVSVARFGHYCHAMRARLTDIRAAQGRNNRLPDRLDICNANESATIVSGSLPRDQFVRGSTSLHQPRDYTPMVSVAFEGLCAISASNVVEDHGRAAFDPTNPSRALELMNTHLIGFPSDTAQHQRTRDMLDRYFNALTTVPACDTRDAFRAALAAQEPQCGLGLSDVDALRDMWTMICQSPSLTGIGQ